MTTTLITGKGGTPHITSGDMGAMQAGIIGNGSYLLQGADGKFPAVTMQDANHALIPVLNLVVEGRYARVTEAETATIESGMSGRNRNDLVCLKYTRNGQNIETAAIAVLKGTPNTGTAADPTVPSGSIHSASGTAWIPIARIPISGITPGTPVMLIKQLPPMSKLWDSVTLYNAKGFTVIHIGMMMLVKYSGNIGNGSWDSVQCEYVLPAELRPPVEVNAMVCVSNGQTARMLVVNPNGTIRCANMGAAGSNQSCVGSLCYPIP
ncbi:hypothetical protein [Bifidobacterium pseudocatenulatum]|uniref:hypothetical protein n=1 Tax=Bifidobacterium pseudocatenulatum TaxID=28026 RepID=UPI000E437AE9|nr:hypothetical protein [Bifidobacterium pseudocatenulatum]RGL08995.1 hypothetical protein DXC83_02730 [Bifidobacterium pseudocatenulatum]